jgi:hypothetical protein
MRRLVCYSLVALAAAAMLAIGHDAAAQTKVAPAGWPAAPTAGNAAAETPRTAAAAKSSPAVTAPAKPVAQPTMAKATEPVAPAVAPSVGDLLRALEEQSAALARLSANIEAQGAIIAEQQIVLQKLQSPGDVVKTAAVVPVPASRGNAGKAVPVTAAPSAPFPAIPVITVDTAAAKLRLSGLFQGWFTAGSSGAIDTFRLRRTEFKFAGEISPRARWTVMIDPSKALAVSNTYTTVAGAKVVADTSVSQSGRVLQDAFLSIVLSPAFAVDLGQQKAPLGLEGTQSSAKLSMIDRALFITDKARGGGWGDVRDLGVVAHGVGLSGQVEYSAGLFNGLGESMNEVDRNNQKSVAGRLLFRPAFVKGLQVGGSMARGSVTPLDPSQRDRRGAEMLFTRKDFGLQAEWMTGRDGSTTRRGFYVQTRERATKHVELLARLDSWTPDTQNQSTLALVTERDWLGGVNFLVAGPGVQFQMNYVHKTFGLVQAAKNLFLANLQAAW